MTENKEREEAAEKFQEQKYPEVRDVQDGNPIGYRGCLRLGFKAGAEWQKERAKVLEEALEKMSIADGADSYPTKSAIEALSKYRGEK